MLETRLPQSALSHSCVKLLCTESDLVLDRHVTCAAHVTMQELPNDRHVMCAALLAQSIVLCLCSSLNGVVEPTLCTPGRYCAENATTLWGHGPCAAGYVCPAGTSSPMPASSRCPAGWFCASGSSSPSSLCQPGYYCPEGSSTPRAYQCPAGTYCFAGSAEPALCPAGSWSSLTGRSSACNLCPAATFSAATGATNYTSCQDCPLGFQCPSAGMAAPLPCPAGYKSAPSGLSCVECPAGTFNQMPGNNASQPCSPCPAGHICRAGTVFPEGALVAAWFMALPMRAAFAAAQLSPWPTTAQLPPSAVLLHLHRV